MFYSSSEGIPARGNDLGKRFYDRLAGLVRQKIKPIFVESGEWPGAYDQTQIKEVHDEIRKSYPECATNKKMNWTALTSWMGVQLKRKR